MLKITTGKKMFIAMFFPCMLSASEWPANIDKLMSEPEIRAFLDSIAFAEGTLQEKGYSTYFGGGNFDSFADHPRQIMCFMSGSDPLCSSAAGRYQILERTWDAMKKELNLRDFSPRNQDKIALALIRSRGALKQVRDNNFKKACSLVSTVWASMPESKFKQRTVSFKELQDFYTKRLLHYKRQRRPFYRLSRQDLALKRSSAKKK